jgi:hypothetical protein
MSAGIGKAVDAAVVAKPAHAPEAAEPLESVARPPYLSVVPFTPEVL